MSIQSKTWTVGEVVTAANMNTYVRDNFAAAAQIYTGTYTGDGTTSKAITGVGFEPKLVWIWEQETDGSESTAYFTTDTIIDNDPDGMAIKETSGDHSAQDNGIIAISSDGFTVDDAGADAHPNKNTQVYDFMCIG